MIMRDFFTKDLGWKALSLVLATCIYLTLQTVRHSGNEALLALEAHSAARTFHDVPVLVVSSAADVREFKVSPARVQVTVNGRPELINLLEEKDVHVTVDLTGIESAINLKKRVDASTPPGVTLTQVNPPEVEVVIPPRK